MIDHLPKMCKVMSLILHELPSEVILERKKKRLGDSITQFKEDDTSPESIMNMRLTNLNHFIRINRFVLLLGIIWPEILDECKREWNHRYNIHSLIISKEYVHLYFTTSNT